MTNSPDANHATLTVLGQHQLTLLSVTPHEDSFSIEYRIAPPLPDGEGNDSPFMLILEAHDDLGNEYTDWGGVFGLNAEGSYTEGEISAQPALPVTAKSLFLRFTYLRGGDENAYETTLPLPFPS